MTSRALRSLPARNPLPGPSHAYAVRHVHASLPRANAAAPPFFAPGVSRSLAQYRLSELEHHLASAQCAPNRVWTSYQALLADADPTAVPQATHQRVLRRCTPSFNEVRKPATRADRDVPAPPHVHESRFRAVVNNIRLGGGQVALDDFHFILRQFAAAGHHTGSRQVLAELLKHGLVPTAKTYSLVFQAMAHRLTLPIRPGQEEQHRKQAAQSCIRMLNHMSDSGVAMNPACVDLVVRILRETADADAFDVLVKNAYGIDLSPPSTTRLGFAAPSPSTQATTNTPEPLPFSISVLNTIVETLGRTERISKLVQAFEVLTTPLLPPREPTEEEVLERDDEDDDADEVPWAQPTPHAAPNTTTYNLLVKWVSRAGNTTLGRHYVTAALEAERLADRRLRNDVHNAVPLPAIAGPRVAVSRRTLQPLVGLAHHRRDVLLLRWLVRICHRVMRRKTVHIGYYQDWVRDLHARGLHEPLPALLTDVQGARRFLVAHGAGRTRAEEVPTLAVDLDAPAEPDAPAPRPFRPAVHIAILQRDLAEVGALLRELEDILGRVVQQRKERLGRRVWAGKDVWVRDTGRRAVLAKEQWADAVGWQPRGVAGKNAWRDVWSEDLMLAERRVRPQAARNKYRAEAAPPSPPPPDTSLLRAEASS